MATTQPKKQAPKKKRRKPALGTLVRAGSAAEDQLDHLKVSVLNVGFYAGLALLIGGGGFLGVRTLLRTIRERSAENDSSVDGRPAFWAGQLLAAFNPSGWGTSDGTDEEMVFATLAAIPTRAMYGKVQTAYRDLTKGRSLDNDLRDEMTSLIFGNSDYQKALQIINSKP